LQYGFLKIGVCLHLATTIKLFGGILKMLATEGTLQQFPDSTIESPCLFNRTYMSIFSIHSSDQILGTVSPYIWWTCLESQQFNPGLDMTGHTIRRSMLFFLYVFSSPFFVSINNAELTRIMPVHH